MAYTINANAKNVWIRDNEDTRDLSIQTDASSVYLDNGRTLEQELGEGSMVSNVATVDSAMSKIIDGTLDGAYESGVMYGRSLVNLSNLHKSFNDVTLSDYYVDTSLCETSKLKLRTPYTLVFHTTVHGGDHDIYDAFELGVGNELHGTNTHPETTTNYWGELVKNGWSKVCVTFTDFLGYKYLSLRPIRCNAPESGKSIRFSIEGFILLEGDWSNKDLPFNDYFTGLCDVKMPILRNVGKNLFDGTVSTTNRRISTSSGGSYASDGYSISQYIQIKPNTTYAVKTQETTYFAFYDKNKQYTNGGGATYKFTTGINSCYVRFDFKSDEIETVQLEESPTPTTYENYKTNILRTSEEIVLREVGGVCDTYNPLTGEYVRRIGEVVLDGSTAWLYGNPGSGWNQNGTATAFYSQSSTAELFVNKKLDGNSVCDRLTTMQGSAIVVDEIDIDCFGLGHANYVVIRKNGVNSPGELQTWLAQNPLTVQYELAEPITTIVEPLTIPFAYQNGHIILESGHEGQSLLPTLEYSTVVNRTGQVESVAKTIQTQEKQLTMLEQMLIQNIIGLDYNNTVLALNLEINEVM